MPSPLTTWRIKCHSRHRFLPTLLVAFDLLDVLNQAANTYGNSQPVMDTANTGSNAQYSYQFASVPRTGIVPGYPTLSTSGQQQIAAQGATTDLSDAIIESNLQTLGSMRSNEIQREQDIENLESASHSVDPAEQTDMATMQRINRAMLLQLRQQQEADQLSQANTLQQIVSQKQQQDAMKAGFSGCGRLQQQLPNTCCAGATTVAHKP